MGSKGTNTTTQTQSATPQALAAYNNLIGSAANAASAQYTPFTSSWASPVNSQQQLGISNINANAMSAQPYYQTALGYMQQAGSMAPTLANMGAQEAGNISGIGAWDSNAINGAGMAGASGILNAGQPINSNNINQYLSPYTGQVVNATEAQFANTNAQQQQSVLGNAAAQYALGGDRVSVAQGILGGQQQAAEAPVIAGLYNTGYQQATQTAEQQQAAQLAAAQSAGQLGLGATEAAGNLNLGAAEAASGTQLGAYQSALQAANAAGYGIGNLGTAAQNSAISGATSQLGAGTEEEQLAYQQYLQQQGYPFQTLGWQAGIDTGVGGAEGGTGTTTAPAPNPFAQYAGAGLTLGALALSDRRAKQNIHKVGKTNDGQPIYRFQYKGHPQWHVGLIAQEVEKDHPDAVHEIGGYKGVDIKKATDDSVRAFGGRVGLADGGSFGGTPYGDATGYVPQAPMIRGVGLPKAPSPQSMVQTPQQMIQGAAAIAKDFKKNSSGASTPADLGYANYDNGVATGIQGVGPLAGGPQDIPPSVSDAAIFKSGGLVQRSGLSRNGVPVRGGMGLSSFVPHFADGGTPYDRSYFDDEFADPIVHTAPNFEIASHDNAKDAYDALASNDAMATTSVDPSGQESPRFVPMGMPRPAQAGVGDVTVADSEDDNLPAQVTGPPQAGVGLSYSGAGPTGGLQAPDEQVGVAPQASPSDSGGWKGLLGLPSDVRQSLMAAGLGMMASRSPFLGSAIGEGGLTGLAQYGALQKQKLAEEKEANDVDLRVKELNQRIKEESDKYIQKSPYQEAEIQHQNAELALEKQKYQAPSGYRVNSNGGLEAVPGGPADPTTVSALAKAKLAGGMFSPDALDIAARRDIAGDPSEFSNLGRGTQGPANIAAARNREAQILADEYGYSPQQAAEFIAGRKQQFSASSVGQSAEARTAGTREANLNMILATTDAAIPAALEASKNVARTGWVPINQIIQKGEVIASDPNLKSFGMANLQLAEGWARAMNPTGVMRESDRDKALSFLNTADSPETYERAVNQLRTQVQRERDAVRSTKAPVPGGPAPSAPQPGAPATPAAGFTGRTATNPTTGQKLRETSDGKWVP